MNVWLQQLILTRYADLYMTTKCQLTDAKVNFAN